MQNNPPDHGFFRLAAASLLVQLANPPANAQKVVEAAKRADALCVHLLSFPALTLSGASCQDLLNEDTLLESCREALERVRESTRGLQPILVVGAPLRVGGSTVEAAVWMHRGEYLGVSADVTCPEGINLSGQQVPCGRLAFQLNDFHGLILSDTISSAKSRTAPQVLASLGNRPASVGGAAASAAFLESKSLLDGCAIAHAAPGFGESTNDVAWDGYTAIFEDGEALATGERFARETVLTTADVDALILLAGASERPFSAPASAEEETVIALQFGDSKPAGKLLRRVEKFPFHTDNPEEVIALQVEGLAQRMRAIGTPRLVIGVSGGLDSTLALLVACRAMDSLGRSRKDILGYTMPGFGTSKQSRSSAEVLSEALGITFAELDIRPAAEAMLHALGHPFAEGTPKYDVTFENVQAGLRTDYLFRLANQHSGIVVGTGDLSELALGWCTYGVGDQMSHYGVNAGVPKTSVQQVLRHVADESAGSDELRTVLNTVLGAEISPELVPADKPGDVQSTEENIGPYELQDFTLHYLLRYGFGPARIAFLARHAWSDKYSPTQIHHWLRVFYRRFFFSQFKREAAPNAPQIFAAASLSPRTGWKMPSDADASVWLEQMDGLER